MYCIRVCVYLVKNSNYQLSVEAFPSKSRIQWFYVSYIAV